MNLGSALRMASRVLIESLGDEMGENVNFSGCGNSDCERYVSPFGIFLRHRAMLKIVWVILGIRDALKYGSAMGDYASVGGD